MLLLQTHASAVYSTQLIRLKVRYQGQSVTYIILSPFLSLCYSLPAHCVLLVANWLFQNSPFVKRNEIGNFLLCDRVNWKVNFIKDIIIWKSILASYNTCQPNVGLNFKTFFLFFYPQHQWMFQKRTLVFLNTNINVINSPTIIVGWISNTLEEPYAADEKLKI